MNAKRYLYLILLSSLLLARNLQAFPDQIHKDLRQDTFEVEIDDTAAEVNLSEIIVSEGDRIRIRSMGGDPEEFINFALKIRKLAVEIQIFDKCFSACAEYMLTLDIEKTIAPETLIGYHWNSDFFLDNLPYEISDQCVTLFRLAAQKRRDYLTFVGIEKHYSDAISYALAPQGSSVINMEMCKVGFLLTFQTWLPSSDQIEQMIGFKAPKNICNNSIACVQERYKRPDGWRLVVGSDMYVREKGKWQIVGTYGSGLDDLLNNLRRIDPLAGE